MKKELIVYRDPKSPVSEMFRTLRTNIQFMNADKELKTLLVTSTWPDEGKSWVSANLAITFAQAGKKVLLVDADMRKGRQFSIFGVSPIPGLSNYLSGVVDEQTDINHQIQDFIQETEVENLFIMPAGNVPPNPSELLVSEKMLTLMKWVKSVFDMVIFDGTPSLLVTDAPIISRIVDSTILVTAYNQTKIDNVQKVKKAIENIGGKVAGVVINKIPTSGKKYENTYYYGSMAGNTKIDKNFLTSTEKKVSNFMKNEQNNAKTTINSNPEESVDNAQNILTQIQDYLNIEKSNLENGDKND